VDFVFSLTGRRKPSRYFSVCNGLEQVVEINVLEQGFDCLKEVLEESDYSLEVVAQSGHYVFLKKQ
jgi:hypothetical protein